MENPLSFPLILSITTSGKTGGLALYKEREFFWEINFLAGESYSRGIFKGLLFLKNSFKDLLSQVDYIAVDVGPGSFTGLRIGLSMVKALDLLYEIPIIPLSSLEILAWNYPGVSYPVLSIIDAYSKELFVGLYKWEGDKFQTLLSPRLIPLDTVKELIQGPTLFASETLEKWEREFKELFGQNFIKPPFSPQLRAGLLSQVALLKLKRREASPVKGEELLPLYLKASEAERKKCSPIS